MQLVDHQPNALRPPTIVTVLCHVGMFSNVVCWSRMWVNVQFSTINVTPPNHAAGWTDQVEIFQPVAEISLSEECYLEMSLRVFRNLIGWRDR
jgi:hypothetical protein